MCPLSWITLIDTYLICPQYGFDVTMLLDAIIVGIFDGKGMIGKCIKPESVNLD